MSTPGSSGMRPPVGRALDLDYPMSVGVYDDYAQAQRAVDHLSDADFPVQNLMIVGTDLRMVERVTGRLTWGRILLGGALTGLWLGAFVGLVLSLFADGAGTLATVVSTMLFGVIFSTAWAAVGYLVTQGRRDFTSVSQVVATKYELLVEHKFAEQARARLAELDGHGLGRSPR